MASACAGPRTEPTLTEPQKVVPHSDLVGVPRPRTQTALSLSNTANHASSGSPPLKPLRSPLRPPARSISSKSSGVNTRASTATQDSLDTPPPSAIDDTTIIVDPNSPGGGFPMTDRDSFATIDELLEEVTRLDSRNVLPKSLAARPDSPPTSFNSSTQTKSESPSSSVSLSAQVPPQPAMTKRQHALHELLSSERAYASDLALIREVHIPLALGQTVPLQNIPASPPDSSASSSRTLSTASDSSTASLGPPMSQDDAKIIFTNIAELAVFSDGFCDELERALGSLVDGGVGEDCVGELFLQIIPDLEKPYQLYITKHPGALQHLQNLTQTPALQAYLSYTRSIASSVSHAWDLASLLIKPVQRLLKYPLLLSAIIDETPDSHPDKENLRQARAMMEEVARNVNEVRRRAEVIKDVLTSKKKPVNVTVAASVNLGKMKNLRIIKAPPVDENSEAAQVERMSQELKRIEVFAQQFAKNIVDWARSMSKVIGALRTWSIGFGKVIGLSPDQGSEAFEAFLTVVEQQLMPLCVDLEAVIGERLLREIVHLLKTMNQPYKLLASMTEQEPLHYHLLNMNVSAKNRPPPTLLAASTNYLALRAQLAAELPTYLALLHQGLSISVRRLAYIQTRFWKDVKDKWGELWEMLRVDGELNAGHEETVTVWQSRWMDVDEVLASLNINQRRKIYQEPERSRSSGASNHPVLANMDYPLPQAGRKQSSNMATEMLSSLDPSQSTYPSNYVSSPLPLTSSSSRHRNRDSAPDDSSYHGLRRPSRRNSNESLHGRFRAAKGKSPARSPARRSERDDFGDYVYPDLPTPPHYHDHQPSSAHQPHYKGKPGGSSMPNLPRRKSMPLSTEAANPRATRRATSPPHGGDRYPGEEPPYSAAYANHPYGTSMASRDSYASERNGRSNVDVSRSSTSSHKKSTDSSSKTQRPTHGRNRSGSITSFFKGDKDRGDRDREREREHESSPVPNLPEPDSRYMSHSNRDSWVTKPAKYVCQVIHPCQPPAAVSYFSFPFFTLVNGDLYEVLQEAGHPSIHPKLPLYVDDGEDCLLLCRDIKGNVGWALASFLEPLNLSR